MWLCRLHFPNELILSQHFNILWSYAAWCVLCAPHTRISINLHTLVWAYFFHALLHRMSSCAKICLNEANFYLFARSECNLTRAYTDIFHLIRRIMTTTSHSFGKSSDCLHNTVFVCNNYGVENWQTRKKHVENTMHEFSWIIWWSRTFFNWKLQFQNCLTIYMLGFNLIQLFSGWFWISLCTWAIHKVF